MIQRRRALRVGLLTLAAVLTSGPLTAQNSSVQNSGVQNSDAQNSGVQDSGVLTLKTSTRLVVVDVQARGKDGQPVHGLTRQDFQLVEDATPQTLRRFEEHSALAPATGPPPAPLKLPPGTYSDYTPVPPGGELNILLLDALNTPTTDQAYVRLQLQEYVKHAAPGTRIAIFGLANRLFLLQGFTASPEILKAAIEKKVLPNTSTLLEDPNGTGADPNSTLSDLLKDGPPAPPGQTSSLAQIAANVDQFEQAQRSDQQQLRIRYTIDAFNALGHYLANYPGRKNLIWFSGSFPLNVFPDTTIDSGSASSYNNNDILKDAIGLLTKAQVAVYPVDARGLLTNPSYSAARTGRNYGRNPGSINTEISKFVQSQAEEHTTMDQLADSTGGHAYYNTNGLAQAVANAIDSGSNFYTLTYSPVNRAEDGRFRTFHIQLVGAKAAAARAGEIKLSYRHGYFADDAESLRKQESAAGGPAAFPDRTVTYAQAAMSRGAPAPEDILFKVQVLPASAATEEAVAPGNQPDAANKVKGPFRRYAIDLATPPSEFHLTATADGRHTGKVDFTVFVYDPDGRVLNRMGRVIDLNLTAETYKRFMAGAVDMHLEVSAPAKGDSYLRIGVQDVTSNRIGVVEIPVADVARLPPAAPR